MPKYKVRITETNAFYFIIEAQDEEEAEEIGTAVYFGEDPHQIQKPLIDSDYKGNGFEVWDVEEITQ